MITNLPTHRAFEIDHAAAGQIVRRRRESKGKSLRWLADKLECSAPYLSDLELGRRNWNQFIYKAALDILSKCKPKTKWQGKYQ